MNLMVENQKITGHLVKRDPKIWDSKPHGGYQSIQRKIYAELIENIEQLPLETVYRIELALPDKRLPKYLYYVFNGDKTKRQKNNFVFRYRTIGKKGTTYEFMKTKYYGERRKEKKI